MANPNPAKPFVKGDPRINRSGRPKDFQAFRELAREIAHEKAANKDGETVVWNGHAVSMAEYILRSWATSKNPILQKAFVEIAFGKVPDNLDITSKGDKIIVTLKAKDDGD